MQRIDGPTAAPMRPAIAPLSGTPGFFTGGDPAIPTPPTAVSVDWLNMIQEELIAVIAAAGLTPDKANNGQVAAAIQGLISGGGVSLASDAETIAGAITNKAVHPHGAAALVANRVAALIGGAPDTLNTLGELAAAIGNNPNFSSDVVQALAARALSSRKILGGGVATGGGPMTDDQTIMVAAASGVEFEAQSDGSKVLTPASYGAAGGGNWENGWAPAPGGRIDQWGSIVVQGDNTSARSFTIAFPRPFLEGCGSIVGNAEPYLTGQGQWHPITVNFTPPTIAGVSGFVDSTNNDRRITGNRRVWWRATGR